MTVLNPTTHEPRCNEWCDGDLHYLKACDCPEGATDPDDSRLCAECKTLVAKKSRTVRIEIEGNAEEVKNKKLVIDYSQDAEEQVELPRLRRLHP